MSKKSARKVWESNQPMRDIEEKTMTEEIEYRTIEGATWGDRLRGDRVTTTRIIGAPEHGEELVKLERPVPKDELPTEPGWYQFITSNALTSVAYVHESSVYCPEGNLPQWEASNRVTRLYTLSDAAEIIADWLRNYYSDPSANAVRREFVDGAK